MKNVKRIFAFIGVILLAGLYLITFILAFMKSDAAFTMFKATLACTVILPILIYTYVLVYKLLKDKNDHEKR